MKLIYVALILPCTMLGMEPQDVEAAQPKPPANDIIIAIRAGKTKKLHQLLQVPAQEQTRTAVVPLVESLPTNIDQVTNALGFTTSELAAQQQQLAKKVGDHLLSRYKPVLIPAGITAASAAALISSALALHNQLVNPTPSSPDSLTKGALAYSIAQSFLAMLGAGYKTGVQIKKGWYDHRQHKVVEQLENAQLLLTMLEAQAAQSNNPAATQVITAAIATTQVDIANLTVAAAKATIEAQDAAKDAATLDAQDTTDKGKSSQPSEPPAPVTRSLLTRGHDKSAEEHEQTQGSATIASQFETTASALPGTNDAQAATAHVATPTPDASKPVVSLQDVITDESAATTRTGTNADQVLAPEAQEGAPQDIFSAIDNLKLVAAQETERYQKEAQEQQAQTQAVAAPAVQETAQAMQQEQDAPPFGIMPATMAWLQEEQQKHEQAVAAAAPAVQEAPAPAAQVEAPTGVTASDVQADGAANANVDSTKKDE